MWHFTAPITLVLSFSCSSEGIMSNHFVAAEKASCYACSYITFQNNLQTICKCKTCFVLFTTSFQRFTTCFSCG